MLAQHGQLSRLCLLLTSFTSILSGSLYYMYITINWGWCNMVKCRPLWMVRILRLHENVGATRSAFSFVPTSQKSHSHSFREPLLHIYSELLKVVGHGETSSFLNGKNPTFAWKSRRKEVSFHVCAYFSQVSLPFFHGASTICIYQSTEVCMIQRDDIFMECYES
jgi:hypothetical protein